MQIQTVQSIRKGVLGVACLVVIALYALTSTDLRHRQLHDVVEWIGIALLFLCILGRTWTSMYIGGRKIEELVQAGPYSICRNPLYLFSVLGAAGVGAQSGSIILAFFCALSAYIVFSFVISQEERVLEVRHRSQFIAY